MSASIVKLQDFSQHISNEQTRFCAENSKLPHIASSSAKKGRAISILSRLLKAPYGNGAYGQVPVMPALLGTIPSGTPCTTILLSKNYARKSSRSSPK
jgi:hypothetical protein